MSHESPELGVGFSQTPPKSLGYPESVAVVYVGFVSSQFVLTVETSVMLLNDTRLGEACFGDWDALVVVSVSPPLALGLFCSSSSSGGGFHPPAQVSRRRSSFALKSCAILQHTKLSVMSENQEKSQEHGSRVVRKKKKKKTAKEKSEAG